MTTDSSNDPGVFLSASDLLVVRVLLNTAADETSASNPELSDRLRAASIDLRTPPVQARIDALHARLEATRKPIPEETS
jgi:hypothetical protein